VPLRRPAPQAPPGTAVDGTRPVLLATLNAPWDPAAAAVAVDAAVETGQPLIVANVAHLPPLGMCVNMRYRLEDPPELAAALRAPAELARSLGLRVELLHVLSPRPVAALVELAVERCPGLLVFGPDRSRVGRRAYRKAAKAIRTEVPCLVWLDPNA
jgi:nucleotide-binding universal stress UspA family protein